MSALNALHDEEKGSSSAFTTSASTAKPTEERCNSLLFAYFCDLLNRIEAASGTQKKLNILFTKDLSLRLQGGSIYPLLRLLLPLVDCERGRYGMKQTSVAKVYINALNLSPHSEDALYLLHWHDPNRRSSRPSSVAAGTDFGSVLEEVLMSRVKSEPSSFTLGEINQLLDEIVSAFGKEKEVIIRNKVVMRFSPNEQKWLMRIVFQDLKANLELFVA